jgi:hypothetical protein
MTDESHHHSLVERLDVALAARLALRSDDVDLGRADDLRAVPLAADPDGDARWVTGVLGLRGFQLDPREAAGLLRRGLAPRVGADQETRLMLGMGGVLQAIRERGAAGQPPDGWFGVELFRRLTGEIARFRGNSIRRDEPWDGVLGVRYPASDAVPALLESFCREQEYGEERGALDGLHPVRVASRLLWGFARLAPFPDFNAVMAFVLMNAYLLAACYPMVPPERGDRRLLGRVIAAPRPRRIVQFESRLLAAAQESRRGA